MAFLSVLSALTLLLRVLATRANPRDFGIASQHDFGIEQERSELNWWSRPGVFAYKALRGPASLEEDEEDDYPQNNKSEEGSSEEDDDVSSEERFDGPPKSRVRRRIIPVGKALEKGNPRSGNPYKRGRSPYAHPPSKSDALVKPISPQGSDALFSLFPNLASSTWRKAHGIGAGVSKSKLQEGDTTTKAAVSRVRRNKRKPKLVKDMKQEVAVYADVHGVDEASKHFTKKFRTPISIEAAEKYLRRFRNRKQKRGDKKD